jgi:hypothetical protein
LTVPFGYPREEGNVKLDPAFAELRHRIWDMLRTQGAAFSEWKGSAPFLSRRMLTNLRLSGGLVRDVWRICASGIVQKYRP